MKNYRVLLFLSLMIVAQPLIVRAQTPTVDQLKMAFYSYDKSLALNPDLKDMPDKSEKLTELRTRWRLTYDSAHDQTVTSIFALPKKAVFPCPAVVLLEGSGGHKDSDYVKIAADMFATMGYATLAIDTQYHGERAKKERSGDVHFIQSDTNRDGWVQTVIDLRRAVDYLQSRKEVDGKRIGYIGFSQGGMIGGTFLGVEPRIIAGCLAVPGGGLVEWGKKAGIFKSDSMEKVELNAEIVDPIYFIGRFSPRPLLILSAKRDELIPKYASEAIFNAAKEPKEIRWFESGHVLPPTAMVIDIKRFFKKWLEAPAKP